MQRIRMIEHSFSSTIEVYVLSDLHIGSPEFAEAAFERIVAHILADPYRHVIIAGDLIDNGIKSSVTSPYSAVMQPNDQRKYAVELLMPLRDRIICIVPGNHEGRSKKDADIDPMELIAERLDLHHLYREDIAFLLLKVGQAKHGKVRPPVYVIGVLHGASNGLLLGAGLNKMEPLAISLGVDVLVMGHTHKPALAPTMRLEAHKQSGCMVQRPVRLMVATAWLDYGGYGTKKMMKPVAVAPNYMVLSDEEFGVTMVQQ